MKVLLINDDGINAPGLWELQKSLSTSIETFVVAPATEQSGRGAGISLISTLKTEHRKEFPCPAWSVEGTPADCVRCALQSILPSPPDLILSGINPGSNAGGFVFASGTVGGVIWGALHGIPGIAFSSANYHEPTYARFTQYIPPIVRYATEIHPIPHGTLLNVTFPSADHLDRQCGGSVAGIKFTRQGKTYSTSTEETDGDTYWVQKGFITIVPVYVGELTHHAYLETAKPGHLYTNQMKNRNFVEATSHKFDSENRAHY